MEKDRNSLSSTSGTCEQRFDDPNFLRIDFQFLEMIMSTCFEMIHAFLLLSSIEVFVNNEISILLNINLVKRNIYEIIGYLNFIFGE